LSDICRKSLWRAAGGPARGFYSTEQMCRIINYEEHKSGPIPDKLKRYLLAPTKHSLPSKILSDEFCRGELYYRQYYSPIKSIESNTESNSNSELQEILDQVESGSGSPILPRFTNTPTPELPELENSNTNMKTKKYNLRSRRKNKEKDANKDGNNGDKGGNKDGNTVGNVKSEVKVDNKAKVDNKGSNKEGKKDRNIKTENTIQLENLIDNEGDNLANITENTSQNSASKVDSIVSKQRGSKKKNRDSLNPIAKKNRTKK